MPDIVLRDYQARDIIRTRSAFQQHKRVLYVSPTGSGKTTLFCEVCRLAVERGGQVLVVVHRKELVKQVSNRLGAFGIQHGVTAGGYKQRLEFPVQVVMVRRAPRLLERFTPTLVVVDEAHHAVAGSWEKTLKAAPAARVLGVTATPARLDGRGLGDAFDTLILGPSVKELTAAGYLVPAHIYAPSAPDMSGARRRGGDYRAEDAAAAVARSSVTGDAVEHYQKLCPGARAVAFCVDVEHAKKTAAAFNAAGIPADVILGEQDDDERERVVRELENGTIRVLCSVDVISEGFDIPAIEAVILLRPTESLALFLQQIGRSLRPAPGKPFAIVLDHAGNALRHGFPDDEFIWSLDGGVKRKRPSDLLSLKRCSNCFMIYRSGVALCPHCGHAETPAARRRIQEREGQLARLNGDIRAEIRALVDRQKAEFKADCAKAVTLEELFAVAKKHRKNRAWAIQLYKNSAWRQRVASQLKSSSAS